MEIKIKKTLLIFVLLLISSHSYTETLSIDRIDFCDFPADFNPVIAGVHLKNKLSLAIDRYYAAFPGLIPLKGKKGSISCTLKLKTFRTNGNSIVRTSVMLKRTSDNKTVGDYTTVTYGSPDVLIQSIAGSIGYLYMILYRWKGLVTTNPPVLSNTFTAHDIFNLIYRYINKNPKTKELLSIDAGNGRITILTSDGYITLGSNFEITEETARDVFSQKRTDTFNYGIPQYIYRDIFNDTVLIIPPRKHQNLRLISLNYKNQEVIGKNLEVSRDFLSTGLYGGGVAIVEQNDKEGLIGTKKLTVFPTLSGHPYTYKFFSGYISACASDKLNRIWMFDAIERKVRIYDKTGREIGNLKPIFPPKNLLFPQEITPETDGGFILAGNGIAVRFDRYGLPLWKLENYRMKTIRTLPAFFNLKIDEKSGNIYIMDQQAKNILVFKETSLPKAGFKAANGKYQHDISELAKALAEAGHDSARELDFHLAMEMLESSLKIYRGLRKQDPVEPSYPSILEKLTVERNKYLELVKRRNELRISLKGKTIKPFPLEQYSREGYRKENMISLHVVNTTGKEITSVKFSLFIEGFFSKTSYAAIQSIPPHGERFVDFSVYFSPKTAKLNYSKKSDCNILTRYRFGDREMHSFITIPVTITRQGE